jgi:hypothetical protein
MKNKTILVALLLLFITDTIGLSSGGEGIYLNEKDFSKLLALVEAEGDFGDFQGDLSIVHFRLLSFCFWGS